MVCEFAIRTKRFLIPAVVLMLVIALSVLFASDVAFAASVDNPNPHTYVGNPNEFDADDVTKEGTLPEGTIDFTDPETNIRYLFEADKPEEGLATVRLIVLDGVVNTDGSLTTDTVSIPSSVSKDGKSYIVTCIQPDRNWGQISDCVDNGKLRSAANLNVFGEDISYADAESAAVAASTSYPTNRLASLSKLVIPESVETISGLAFGGCTGMVSVDFGKASNLKDISGAYTFRFWKSLESIELPSGLGTLGTNGTFFGCSNLRFISIPKGVTEIPQSCFEGCTSLVEVKFENPVSITGIGQFAFNGCALSTFNLSELTALKTIGNQAFFNTQMHELFIPDWVESLGSSVSSARSISCPASVYSNAGNRVSVITLRSGEGEAGSFGFPGACFRLMSNLEELVFEGDNFKLTGSVVTTSSGNPNVRQLQFGNATNLKRIVFTGETADMEIAVDKSVFSTAWTAANGFTSMSDVVFYAYASEGDLNDPLVKWCNDNSFTYKSLNSIDGVSALLANELMVFNGEEQKPAVIVKDGENELKEGIDYKVAFFDNVEIGTAAVVVSGLDRYSAFEQTLTFKIVADKSALDEAIADAEVAQAEAVASADGSDVAKDAKWVPEDVATALDDALAAAKEASEDDAATKAAVDEACTALVDAVEAFRSAEKPGTMVDKTALNDAIAEASAIEQGKKTDEAKAALDEAIAAAQAVADDPSATEEGVAAALSALEDAVKAFNESADAVEPEPGPEPEPEPAIVPATADTRFAGKDALATMQLIVKAGFGKSDAVVVASLDGYWDALAASSLAGKVGCPVLMTDPKSLSAETASEIARLGASKAYIAGGTAAVSDNVESQLKAKGLSVERLWGADAQVTAVKIAGALGSDHASTCVIATSGGYWDALSASPYAYVAKAPVFLTDSDGVLRADTLAAIKAGGYTSAVIAGGTAAVDKSAEAALKGAGVSDVVRCGGKDAYETAVLLAKWEMAQGMGVSHIGVATSANGYWDALSGAALCGVNNSVIVLADEGATGAIDALVAPNAAGIEAVNVFGGTMAIGPGVDTAIAKALAGNAKLAAQSSAQLVAASLAA